MSFLSDFVGFCISTNFSQFQVVSRTLLINWSSFLCLPDAPFLPHFMRALGQVPRSADAQAWALRYFLPFLIGVTYWIVSLLPEKDHHLNPIPLSVATR